MGAFFLIKYDVFISAGMFDEGTFLFREEEILAIKLLKYKYVNYYNPDVSVIHLQEKKPYEINLIADISDLYFYKNILGCSSISILFYKLSKYIFKNFYLKLLKKLMNIIY